MLRVEDHSGPGEGGYGRSGVEVVGVSAAVNPPLFAGEVLQNMWRFSSFGEINRLFFACAVASAVSAAVAIGLGLRSSTPTALSP